MRISDWSSDVCSSDLGQEEQVGRRVFGDHRFLRLAAQPPDPAGDAQPGGTVLELPEPFPAADMGPGPAEIGRQRGQGVEAGVEALLGHGPADRQEPDGVRSEEHTSELQSLMRISYAVFCLKKKNTTQKRIIAQ